MLQSDVGLKVSSTMLHHFHAQSLANPTISATCLKSGRGEFKLLNPELDMTESRGSTSSRRHHRGFRVQRSINIHPPNLIAFDIFRIDFLRLNKT
jgi:hypothetical protein